MYDEVLVKSATYRAISTQHPPIDLFENLCAPEEYEQACLWEMFTNERVRNVLLPHEDCVFGEGASYVMAPFFYKMPPARFSTTSFGGYYAAVNEITAIYEKAHHLSDFIAATEEEAFSSGLKLLILKGKVNTNLHDLTNISYEDPIYNSDSYETAQQTSNSLYETGSNGILYNSIRNKGNHCLVAFKPKQVTIPITTKRIPLHYNGKKIDKFFDNEEWQQLF